jgi:hypothetical protein
MVKTRIFVVVSLFAAGFPSIALLAESPGHITGVGGIFVTSRDPKALANGIRTSSGSRLRPGAVPYCATMLRAIRPWLC